MDTSELYIKMCEKAVEIQEQRRFTNGNFVAEGGAIFVQCEDCCNEHSAMTDFVKGETWLPRQDQLQEMSGCDNFPDAVSEFWAWLTNDNYDNNLSMVILQKFNSAEQLWLAFVMETKFDKVWNGEDWIKEE